MHSMRMRLGICACIAVAAWAVLACGLAWAHHVEHELPPGYRVDAPIEGLNRPTALAFAANGDVFVAERNGRVKVLDGVEDVTPMLALDIAAQVHSVHDRGLVTLALDPDYPDDPYLYLSYPYDAPPGQEAPVHEQGPDGDDNCVLLDGGEENCLASGRVTRFKLDPATGVALGGASSPSAEEVLVQGWCQQFPVHSLDDLVFDAEGALLASGGEGANFASLDFGQFGNPCGDPPNEGGSLRSQDLESRGDPTGYSGSVIRIDPDTGNAVASNPLFGDADLGAQRIVGFGLRNPFRLAFRPGTSELYVANVGSGRFDEVDLIADPSAPDGPPNFGWPCFEGPGPEPGFRALAFSVPLFLCRDLYESPGENLKFPYFSYPRSESLFAGDECDPSAGAAIAGLAFYERPDAALDGALPEALDGALLLADAARGCIWTMDPGVGGRPDPSTLRNLILPSQEDEGAFVPVDLVFGPEGALYFPDFWNDRIDRLRFFEGNQPPLAELEADRTFGDLDEGKFTVELDGSESTDDGEAPLEYEWDLDGDGVFELGPSLEPTLEHEYEAGEDVTTQLRVRDEHELFDVDRVQIFPGDHPPVFAMESPAEGFLSTVGERVALEGVATDPDEPGGEEEDVRLDWDVVIRHCPVQCHSHPYLHYADRPTASVVAPDHEYPSHLQVTLTATDERGLSQKIVRKVQPHAAEVTLRSDPPGIPLTIDTVTRDAPFAQTLLAGGEANVGAPEVATVDGRAYSFELWSDGGARTHLIRPFGPQTLVARYAASTTAGPLAVPPITRPRRVTLRFVSRPGGLPLRVGRHWRRSKFGLSLERGRAIRLAAPRRLVRRGRVFTFFRWTDARLRVRRIGAARSRAYVAVFKSRPLVHNGLRQALSWRRRAR